MRGNTLCTQTHTHTHTYIYESKSKGKNLLFYKIRMCLLIMLMTNSCHYQKLEVELLSRHQVLTPRLL